MTKSKIFLTLCLGLIGGVFLGAYLNFETMALLAIVFVIIGSVGWMDKRALLIAATGLVALLGAWRFQQAVNQNDLKESYGQEVSGTGTISEEPDVRSDKVFLTINEIVLAGQARQSKILFNVPRYPEYQYGEQISFSGKLVAPKDATNPGDFSYKNYLSRFGIDGLIYYPKIQVAGQGGNWIKSKILKFKQAWVGNVARLLPEPQNAFLGGLLLGAKRAIPQWLIDEFNATGTSHIIAVSGYNITIIAFGIDWLLRRFLHKRISFVISIIAITIFVIMTGASASVVRAGIMGAMFLIALNIGRLFVMTNALAATAAVMLLINPQILRFDVGFQLSFTALLGLVYFTPVIEPCFQWLPKLLRTVLVSTLAAQIFVLPILMYNFSQLSLIAPVANIFVLPLVPLTMLFGFLAGLVSFVWTPLAYPFAWISWLLLTYIIKAVGFFAHLPYSYLQIGFNDFWFSASYLGLALIIIIHYRWNRKSKI